MIPLPPSSSEYGECSKDARGRGAIVGEVEGAGGVSMMSARSARRLTFGNVWVTVAWAFGVGQAQWLENVLRRLECWRVAR